MGLSKSLFMRGLQCKKSLWLHINNPAVKSATDESQDAFQLGYIVGDLGRKRFPGGVLVAYDGHTYTDQIARTAQLLAEGTTTIYEAAFMHDDVFVKLDILHKTESGWEMYEVKSSTSAKPHYIPDIALQYYVASGAGCEISKAALLHINNQYVRCGDIDPGLLFTCQDLTQQVLAEQQQVSQELLQMKLVLAADEPQISLGRYCETPYLCDFWGYCSRHLPENSVFCLAGLGKPDSYALHNSGVVRIDDISPGTLGWRQQMQIDGLLQHKDHIDTTAIRSFLSRLTYPLYFLDFETTFMTAVPLFDRTRPYQQVPFQFSCHVVDTPGVQPRHFAFLAQAGNDPQREFIQKLLEVVPDSATIVAWNMKFEKARLAELATAFPEFSAELHTRIDNFIDLMHPFEQRALYLWQFNGSYSIKSVLPVMVPELSYHDMEISDGGAAATAWIKLAEIESSSEREQLEKALLDYCCLDTLAMVKILEKMQKMV